MDKVLLFLFNNYIFQHKMWQKNSINFKQFNKNSKIVVWKWTSWEENEKTIETTSLWFKEFNPHQFEICTLKFPNFFDMKFIPTYIFKEDYGWNYMKDVNM
jgi:hypothetical protein